MKSPISLKLLVLLYLYYVISEIPTFINPTEAAPVEYSSVIFFIIHIAFLAMVFLRISWTWKAGFLYEIFSYVHLAVSMFWYRDEATSKALEALALTPEKTEQMLILGIGVGSIGLFVRLFLWYKSRSYFQNNQMTEDLVDNQTTKDLFDNQSK